MPSIATVSPVSSSDREPPLDQMSGLVARTVGSPVGALRLVASAHGLVAVLWPDDRAGRVPMATPAEADNAVLRSTEAQLAEYFAGRRRVFDVPLEPRGTAFQLAVWRQLATIPYGETRSYGAIAAAMGRPSASRAVGAANGRNPISILVPCHRVIGTSGTLTGFAGGLETKRRLLMLEGCYAARLL